jgi:hypothetical protein
LVVEVRLDRELVAVREGELEEVRKFREHAARVTIAATRALSEVGGGRRGSRQPRALILGERFEPKSPRVPTAWDPRRQHSHPLPEQCLHLAAAEWGGDYSEWGESPLERSSGKTGGQVKSADSSVLS